MVWYALCILGSFSLIFSSDVKASSQFLVVKYTLIKIYALHLQYLDNFQIHEMHL